jgi:hypothetical protein
MITEAQIADFANAVSAKILEHYKKSLKGSYQSIIDGTFNHAHVGYSIGKKYARLMVPNGSNLNGSCFCFVDMSNGNILKSASWSTPAKGARGHISNGANDVSPYGAAYKR